MGPDPPVGLNDVRAETRVQQPPAGQRDRGLGERQEHGWGCPGLDEYRVPFTRADTRRAPLGSPVIAGGIDRDRLVRRDPEAGERVPVDVVEAAR